MNIKFSHNYPKLHNQKTATLIDVLTRDRSELCENFIDYDTTYDGGKFPLPPGIYMILLFIGCDLIPFTTVRRYSSEKYSYYRKYRNNVFEIQVILTDNML